MAYHMEERGRTFNAVAVADYDDDDDDEQSLFWLKSFQNLE